MFRQHTEQWFAQGDTRRERTRRSPTRARREQGATLSLYIKNALPHFVRAVNRREAWGRAFEVKAFCTTVRERQHTAGSNQDFRSNS